MHTHTQTKYKYGTTRISDLSNITFNRDDIGCQLYFQHAKWSMNLTNNLQMACAVLLHTALRAMHKVDKIAACMSYMGLKSSNDPNGLNLVNSQSIVKNDYFVST